MVVRYPYSSGIFQSNLRAGTLLMLDTVDEMRLDRRITALHTRFTGYIDGSPFPMTI
jgi:hypothetical protein